MNEKKKERKKRHQQGGKREAKPKGNTQGKDRRYSAVSERGWRGGGREERVRYEQVWFRLASSSLG